MSGIIKRLLGLGGNIDLHITCAACDYERRFHFTNESFTFKGQRLPLTENKRDDVSFWSIINNEEFHDHFAIILDSPRCMFAEYKKSNPFFSSASNVVILCHACRKKYETMRNALERLNR